MDYTNFHRESIERPEDYWGREAKRVQWLRKPSKVLSTDKDGFHRWFRGGKLNTCHLALDRHVEAGLGNQAAICYESPGTGTSTTYTYAQVLELVQKVAGMLKDLGVTKGDRVIIYMPMIPETVFAMLACARLGAIHSVVFGGFAAHELALRIDDAQPKVILTASAGLEFDKWIPYVPLVEKAVDEATHKVPHVVLKQRAGFRAEAKNMLDWDSLAEKATPAAYVPVLATDPLYILYTSGTTGKPKGIVRDNGGHAVALLFSLDYVYGIQQGDVFWAASDVGWVVGHSYIVYAPLLAGCTTILYEGKPVRTPDAGKFWQVIEKYKVNVLFTAPTAIRAIKKEDPQGALISQYNMNSLRQVFLAGERCDIATLEWLQAIVNRPVLDHWWQTESGWPMLANSVKLGIFPVKPGSACKPVMGFDIQILDADGNTLPIGEEGAVGIKLPLPPGCLPFLWNAKKQYKDAYLSAFEGFYFSGDGGYCDADGYFYITGRIDDVINVSGHRLSTADMEEIVSAHSAVAECAVVGANCNLRGQVPVGYVILKSGETIEASELESSLAQMVREKLGAIACFKTVYTVQKLPKTRSGKILRKIMRAIIDGKEYQAPSTIEDLSVLQELENIGIKYREKNS